MILSKLWTYHFGELHIQKIDGALIFTVLENKSPNLGLCQKGENRLAINFHDTRPPKMVCPLIITQKLSSLPKYGSQTPSRTYFAPHPVFAKTHKNLCVVHKHGFECKIRSTGSSTPIFWVQSYQRTYLCKAYRPGESYR